MKTIAAALLAGLAHVSLALSPALADVTVLGWPGGPEETALRAVADIYNESGVTDDEKVKLIFFNRDGFWDKLQADLAAGSTEFDLNLLATYAIGKYAPFMDPVTLPEGAKTLFGEKVLKTMEYDGKQFGVPTDLSLHFMYTRKDLIEKLLSDDAWKAKYAEIAKDKLGKDLAPKDPDKWTWDDYAATALFFTKSINPDSPTRYGTVLQMKNLLFNIMVWQSTARSNGGDWMDASGKITVDSEAYRKGSNSTRRSTTPARRRRILCPTNMPRRTQPSAPVRPPPCFNGTRPTPTSTTPKRRPPSPARSRRSLRRPARRAAAPTSTVSDSASTRTRPIRKPRPSSCPGSRPRTRWWPMPRLAARRRSPRTWRRRSRAAPISSSSAASPGSTASS